MHLDDMEECCGITILNQVEYARAKPEVENKLLRMSECLKDVRPGMLVTMTLTDSQLSTGAMKKYFLPAIFDMGWTLVTRFCNPNSGNTVNVFHLVTKDSALRKGRLHRKYPPSNQGKQEVIKR